jgi:hypothetical protein
MTPVQKPGIIREIHEMQAIGCASCPDESRLTKGR